jgi:hypothetical protein
VDDKVKAAIAGFNAGLGGYMLIRVVPSFINGKIIIDGSWVFTNLLIGAAIGAVLAAIAYVAMMQMQK